MLDKEKIQIFSGTVAGATLGYVNNNLSGALTYGILANRLIKAKHKQTLKKKTKK